MSAIRITAAIALVCLALAAAGCGGDAPRALALEIRVAEEAPDDGLQRVPAPILGHDLFLHPDAALTAAHIDSATVVRRKGRFLVGLQLTAEGSVLMAETTAASVGKRIAILVDGEVVSAPICRAAITGGRAVIDGGFTEEQAAGIADGLNRK